MHTGVSDDFKTAVVIVDETDFPVDAGNLIRVARGTEATKLGGDTEMFIIRFPLERFEGAYDEASLRGIVDYQNRKRHIKL